MKELKQYYRDIAKQLPVGRKQKQQILLTITQSVEDYLAAHPLADFQAVQAHFGSPQEITAAYIENMTTPEILKKFRFRKTIIIVVCSVAAVALLMWAAVVGSALMNELNQDGGFVVVEPVVEVN